MLINCWSNYNFHAILDNWKNVPFLFETPNVGKKFFLTQIIKIITQNLLFQEIRELFRTGSRILQNRFYNFAELVLELCRTPSRTFQNWFQNFSELVLEFFRTGSRTFQNWFQNFSELVLECFRTGSRNFQNWFQNFSELVLELFKTGSRTFQNCFQNFSELVLELFRTVSRTTILAQCSSLITQSSVQRLIFQLAYAS